MTTNDKNYYIPKEELLSFTMSQIGNLAVNDVGWWLETKTDNKFTVVECEFILQAFGTLDALNTSTSETVQFFKKEWLTRLDMLHRERYRGVSR